MLTVLGGVARTLRRAGLQRPLRAVRDAADTALLRFDRPPLRARVDGLELHGFLRHRSFLADVERDYEPTLRDLIVSSLDDGSVFVDVGAHIGFYSMLARRAGARVIATTSTAEKARLAREAGAHETVDYRAPDAAERLRAAAPDGIDRVVELSLGRNLELDLAAANPNLAIASYANEAGGDVPVPVRRLMGPNVVLRFVLVYTMGDDAIRAAVEHVASAVADGALTTLPLHRFDLDHAADAHDAVEAGAVGKVVIDLP
jgi:NADPH2:quinone reductase